MPFKQLKSSAITGFDYNAATREFDVHYVGGGQYRYKDVPPEIPAGIEHAKSAGAYMGTHVRGKYEHTRLDKKKEAA